MLWAALVAIYLMEWLQVSLGMLLARENQAASRPVLASVLCIARDGHGARHDAA